MITFFNSCFYLWSIVLLLSKASATINSTELTENNSTLLLDESKNNDKNIYPASWGFPYKLHAKGGPSYAGLIKIPDRNKIDRNKIAREKHGGAEIVQSSHFELQYILGRKIIFICVATGYPRPTITWFKDGVELYSHNYFQVHEWEIGEDKLKSKMEIDPATPMDVGYYECQANNEIAFDFRGFRTNYKASM